MLRRKKPNNQFGYPQKPSVSAGLRAPLKPRKPKEKEKDKDRDKDKEKDREYGQGQGQGQTGAAAAFFRVCVFVKGVRPCRMEKPWYPDGANKKATPPGGQYRLQSLIYAAAPAVAGWLFFWREKLNQ